MKLPLLSNPDAQVPVGSALRVLISVSVSQEIHLFHLGILLPARWARKHLRPKARETEAHVLIHSFRHDSPVLCVINLLNNLPQMVCLFFLNCHFWREKYGRSYATTHPHFILRIGFDFNCTFIVTLQTKNTPYCT